jgi:uncharacterized membrane protein
MKNLLLSILHVVGQTIGTILMLIVMCIVIPCFIGLFLIVFVGVLLAWAVGMPIKVTTPGRFGNKVSHRYRWFTRVD